jgi:hypothetical protein
VDLTFKEIEVDLAQSIDIAETLAQIFNLQHTF